jgi:hypothetical protein
MFQSVCSTEISQLAVLSTEIFGFGKKLQPLPVEMFGRCNAGKPPALSRRNTDESC